MRGVHLVLLAAVLPAGCRIDPPRADQPEHCAPAEQHLLRVCPERARTPAGQPFAEFCKDLLSNQIRLNLRCIMAAKSCREANECPQT